MGGVGSFPRRPRLSLELRRRAVAIKANASALLRGIAIAEEPVQWHHHLVGIAQQKIAIAISEVHRLHHQVNRGSTV